MATKKKGILTPPPEWWKHLKWMKRVFWHKERLAVRTFVRKEIQNE